MTTLFGTQSWFVATGLLPCGNGIAGRSLQ